MSADTILLVEDDDDDADLMKRAFAAARIANAVVRARDGVEALDYLLARGAHAGRPRDVLPVVVLLDLKLPRVGGLEVLKQIRETEHTKLLPVVILTSSDEDRDRLAAYTHHANSYVRKPVNYDEFLVASRQLGLYWTVTNRPAPLLPVKP
jgi:two-component system response regulator